METKLVSSAVALDVVFSDLVRLETELWDLVDRRLRGEHDLPLAWFEPMQVIERVPDCRVADIAAALSITVGGTSKLVDRIERAGWCTRRPHPDDGRSSVLALTEAGQRLLTDAGDTFEDELEAWLGVALTSEQLVSLASTVHELRQHIAEQGEDGR